MRKRKLKKDVLMPRTGSACSQARQAGLAGLPCPGRYSTKTSAANNAWKRGHEEHLRTKKGKTLMEVFADEEKEAKSQDKSKKEVTVDEILQRLGRTYKDGAGVRRVAKDGLMKLSRSEVGAIYAMVLTTSDYNE